MYIETHAHILDEFFYNKDIVIKKALSVEVNKIINCSDNLETSYEVVNLAKKYPKVIYPAVGIHPENIEDIDETTFEQLEKIVYENKVVAIGEIGLDYHHTKEKKEEQKIALKRQLDIAEKNKLPVIIHSRDAIQDTYDILKEYNLRGIIHSYSGSIEMAEKLIKLGYFLGINGIITFKNSKNIKEVVKHISTNHLVLETDCPFLTPEPYRKYQNEPYYIPKIAKAVAEIKNEKLDFVKNQTTKNATELFDIEN